MSTNEFTQAQLLDRVNSSRIAEGNPRVQQVVARIVGDLFRAIDELDVSADEFWAGIDWLTRLGQSGQAGLITAGVGWGWLPRNFALRSMRTRLSTSSSRRRRSAILP